MLTGALLGAGNVARLGHVPAYLGSSEVRSRLRIAAVADLCPDNLAAVAALLPGVRTYHSAESLLAAERPDFVDICAPPYAHRGLIELAANAGCHVLCEKPLATALGDALWVRRLLAGRGLVVAPCHQYHHAPPWQALRAVLRSGEIGPVSLGLISVQRVQANRGSAAWNPAWRTDPCLAGGGILVDHGTHLFYQLHALFGPPEAIACRTERRLPGCGVDDVATLTLRYADRRVRMHLTWSARARSSSHRYFGPHGEVACLDDRIVVKSKHGERITTFGSGLSTGSAHSDWFTPLLLEFACRIAQRDCRLDGLDEAAATAAYITLAYASAANGGRPVRWQDPLDVAIVADGCAAG